MTSDDRPSPSDKRRERLEAQLRENLKRRKAQAKARRESVPHPPADAATAGEDES